MALGVFLFFFSATIFSSYLQNLKSYQVNQWLGNLSIKGFMYALEQENHYFSEGFFKDNKRETVSSLLFSIATDIHTDDIRSLIGKEIPGMSQYYSEILVAGEGTDHTNIPNESSVPLDEIVKDRQVATDKVNEADKESPAGTPTQMPTGKNTVLIYHTHSWESFLPLIPGATKPNQASSPKVNVSLLGDRLQKRLEAQGIPVDHDKTNIGDYLSKKGWDWYKSYNASREVVEEAMAQDKNITYLIDIHRDDRRKKETTKVINGKSYARLYFIVGMENKQYEQNIEITKAINSYLEEKYYGISRGIFKKYYKQGNGVYNQDLSPHAMLIEIGGVDNTLEELYNTVDVLAEALSHYYWQAEKVNN
ncbi:stage II sporulation protein P [Bacillus sp. 165]|uniref:stage II sporulation protein P n=1 Tax=Bacillus sp. 165 TaxID=1529117 RepID=UPI001ADBAD05|nr:stage II sporulation protein P [Bacillus sp. 165]MBO9128956.1 stage II sporulation protein P [Bacillus sp. 165]